MPPPEAEGGPTFEDMFGDESALLTRRELGAGLGALGLLVATGGAIESVRLVRNFLRRSGNTITDPSPQIQGVFAEGLKVDWQTLNVFPGLLVIDPATPAYSDMSRQGPSRVSWQVAEGEAILATRPIFVADTLRTHSKFYDAPWAARIESAAKRLPQGLVALWTPKEELVYVDAHTYPDLVTPIFRSAVGVGVARGGDRDRLIIPQEIQIDGRELVGNTPYLYLNRGRFERPPLTKAQQALNERRFDPSADPALRAEIADTILSLGHRVDFRIPIAHSLALGPEAITYQVGMFLDDSTNEAIIMTPPK